MRNYVIGGNWKLQINSLEETKNTLISMKEALEGENIGSTSVFLALPYTSLHLGKEILTDSKISLAAQNVHYDESGPYTGEISIESLKEFNVEFVLIGHSERRIIFEETDIILNKKLLKVLDHGLKVVFCIGETAAQRNSGDYENVLAKQLEMGLTHVSEEQLSSVVIAYEPVWAINNKLLNPDSEIKAATPEEADNTHAFVRSWIANNYSESASERIQIQYGGSMKPSNCSSLLSLSNIDGGLIGGASLKPDTFIPIILETMNN